MLLYDTIHYAKSKIFIIEARLFINPLVKHVEPSLVTGTENPFHERKNLFRYRETLTRRTERVKRTGCVAIASKTGSASAWTDYWVE